MNASALTVIVMGVSGCGKSLIGSRLAQLLGGVFEDADDFHPPSNKQKMSQGIPLNDADRWPWYRTLRERIVQQRSSGKVYVLACSALKEIYRDKLREGDGTGLLIFVYLKGSRALIGERIGARKGHYMPASLLDSQFAALEEPREAIIVDVAQSPDEIVESILKALPSCR